MARRAPSSAATRFSSSGSCGEWMRLTPQLVVPRSSVDSSSTDRSTWAKPSPPAPKKPSISARASSMTMRVVAMPLAISPPTYGKRTPCASQNERSPSHSGYSAGNEPSSSNALSPAGPTRAMSPSIARPTVPRAASRTTCTGSRTRRTAAAIPAGSNAGGASPVRRTAITSQPAAGATAGATAGKTAEMVDTPIPPEGMGIEGALSKGRVEVKQSLQRQRRSVHVSFRGTARPLRPSAGAGRALTAVAPVTGCRVSAHGVVATDPPYPLPGNRLPIRRSGERSPAAPWLAPLAANGLRRGSGGRWFRLPARVRYVCGRQRTLPPSGPATSSGWR